jgi:hypothetical protein
MSILCFVGYADVSALKRQLLPKNSLWDELYRPRPGFVQIAPSFRVEMQMEGWRRVVVVLGDGFISSLYVND